MARKTLQVIETAYRGTLEEQDDTVVWLTHAMAAAGGAFTILLRGNAVNYVCGGQDASGLRFGKKAQTHPPSIAADLAKVMGKGVAVHVVREDLMERGVEGPPAIPGVKVISKAEVPALFEEHDLVWHW